MGRREMIPQTLIETARALVADDKGLLAMDESDGTCNRRFAKAGIPQTEEARRAASSGGSSRRRGSRR
jgi:fructose-bisphosphate aldolase class I